MTGYNNLKQGMRLVQYSLTSKLSCCSHLTCHWGNMHQSKQNFIPLILSILPAHWPCRRLFSNYMYPLSGPTWSTQHQSGTNMSDRSGSSYSEVCMSTITGRKAMISFCIIMTNFPSLADRRLYLYKIVHNLTSHQILLYLKSLDHIPAHPSLLPILIF